MGQKVQTLPEYLLTHEAASYLRISVRRMLTLLKTEDIPHQRIGRGYRIRRADLDALFERSSHKEPPHEPG